MLRSTFAVDPNREKTNQRSCSIARPPIICVNAKVLQPYIKRRKARFQAILWHVTDKLRDKLGPKPGGGSMSARQFGEGEIRKAITGAALRPVPIRPERDLRSHFGGA